ncbi:hypothetical protein Taro_042921 [Colocasia esculenta]|uniref:DUF676 domain-containing protein n=1 Tax=Colocasia esculenta TaxID=4460 RepID=A0A843WF40_COLES|nr:hypothetical protein [Colocasia esculenta]
MGYPNAKAKRRVVSAAREDTAPAGSSMEGAAEEVRSKKTSRKRGYIRRRLGCFGSAAAGNEREVAGDGALPEREALGDGSRSGRVPTHLVITVNGIIGSAGNWRFAAMQFLKKLPENVIVHRSRCNCNLATFDGVDVMGERLAEEVLEFVQDRPELQKISFVAHSLGGLISRYAIAKLYDPAPHKETSTGNGNHKDLDTDTQFLEVKAKGKIAGLEPMNFITFATPHLGSRWHRQVPVFCGFPLLEHMASGGSWMLGRTGRHLFLKDNDDGKPPLLLQMVKDSKDLHFISALQSFRRCVAYANVCLDRILPKI